MAQSKVAGNAGACRARSGHLAPAAAPQVIARRKGRIGELDNRSRAQVKS